MSAQQPVVRLACKSQSYDWGKLGSESTVAKLASATPGFEVKNDTPYAEFWMGTHPNGASASVDSNTPLKSLLNESNLGAKLHKEYNGDLPFLFKVLSIRKALSIQAHPDKTLAADLHKRFPDVYKDPNHKPEMAVAVTPFEAFINFRPLADIKKHLTEFPEFRALIGDKVASHFESQVSKSPENVADNKAALKALFKQLMESDQSIIANHLQALIKRIKAEGKKDGLYELVVRLNDQFPDDMGVFCAFLLNYVTLNPGESIFLAANEPHAYLSGDCVECMAASDNVIRSGLTPKFKDVDTLVNCLTYNYGPADAQILRGDPYKSTKHTTLYDPPIDEFSILRTKLDSQGEKETVPAIDGPSILIVTEGEGSVKYPGGGSQEAKTGYVLFIAAGTEVTLEAKGGNKPFTSYRAFCV
ncbi:mannose-6-phosphate isomerase [Fimicolochytrium jonesii]|uniref:mannose-6-phosphate isomerase n=1 Tax=Fimicolochytrium jonesii TaxID=1396493 RepID=UPI0022FE116E|nr:mannose-6-phosphate isomerase [Fimicolochytrium jonesii]KAI8825307.1 mannose-6-phosphate isomerase [Fimicolochytrium jonesii]